MSEPTRSSTRGAWRWVPTLYFAEGLPYAIVILVSVIMYKAPGCIEYGNCTLHQLALFAVGNQAHMESDC